MNTTKEQLNKIKSWCKDFEKSNFDMLNNIDENTFEGSAYIIFKKILKDSNK